MPLHLVEADLANGALVPLTLAESDAATSISMSAIYRTDTPPGPAGRWLIDRLKQVPDASQAPERVSSGKGLRMARKVVVKTSAGKARKLAKRGGR
jgi:hypothetical protein